MKISKSLQVSAAAAIAGTGVIAGVAIASHSGSSSTPQLVVRQDAATSSISATAKPTHHRSPAARRPHPTATRATVVASRTAAAVQGVDPVTEPSDTASTDQPVAPQPAPATTSSDVVVMTAAPNTSEPGVTRAPTPPQLTTPQTTDARPPAPPTYPGQPSPTSTTSSATD